MLLYIMNRYIKPGVFTKNNGKFTKGILNFNTDKKNQTGRWTILNCNKLIDERIDRSNNDHCGPCGYEILDKKIDK